LKRFFAKLLVFTLIFSGINSATALADLQKGDRGDEVKKVQQGLIEKGLLSGEADGIYGSSTQTAVEQFQEYLYTLGLADVAVTGVADEITQTYLETISYNPYETELKLGDEGDRVALLQSRLISLNYLAGSADGNFGAKTEEALKLFQKIHKDFGLSQTGVADEATYAILFSADAIHADEVVLRALKDGDTGVAVEKLQQWLQQYGFMTGAADGAYGKKTTQAVKKCQQQMKALGMDVSVTGDADVTTLTFLSEGYDSFLREVSLDAEDSEVERVQARLYMLNYMDVLPTGTFGQYTYDALKDFQSDNGLSATGVADRETQLKLFSTETQPAERATRRQLNKGDSGKTVQEMQERLLVWGFLSGVPSADYDNKTIDAIVRMGAYLEDQGIMLDIGDGTTLTPAQQLRILDGEIDVYQKDVQSGDKGEEVYRVQRRLHTLYYIGAGGVDGKAGSGLTAAIEKFQENNKLAVTGVADAQTQKILFSENAVDGGTKYLLKISIAEQKVYAYLRGEDGQYTLVQEMICSTGLPGTPTPTGIFLNTWPQHRWHYFTEFECWAQYTFVINGNILFHSVLYSSASESTLRYSSLYALGRQASHGCIRLKVADAKWIYQNCSKGTVVVVYDT